MAGRAPLTYVGVDGCPGGRWATVRASEDQDSPVRASEDRAGSIRLTVEVVSALDGLVEELRTGRIAAIAVDMPIGLLDVHPRPADVAARALLGPRRSSVFPTPVRATLGSSTYAEACDRSRGVCGKALSKQAYHLLDRIELLDRLVSPLDQDRLVESHPELAFLRLNGSPLEFSKHTREGLDVRLDLLASELPRSAIAGVLDTSAAPRADLLDALALVTTARRIVRGEEVRLGSTVDPSGKRAEVAF
ncbi:MAG: DUF429 domain-containing protein [Actinomycetota bacterium]|nr:DUF429 domain-containing protein [Actinomycetota bacterium]